MIRYFIYFPTHLLGILLVFAALGGIAFHHWRGSGDGTGAAGRKTFRTLHIVGLLLILTGGFGLMKVIGIKHASIYPNWLMVKLTIWTVLCFATLIIHRFPQRAPLLLVAFVVLGAFSATIGKFKSGVIPDRGAGHTAAPSLSPPPSYRPISIASGCSMHSFTLTRKVTASLPSTNR